ncbi:MAG: hypothetical protein Q9226_001610 [Calogaya cf. arnoldii]
MAAVNGAPSLFLYFRTMLLAKTPWLNVSFRLRTASFRPAGQQAYNVPNTKVGVSRSAPTAAASVLEVSAARKTASRKILQSADQQQRRAAQSMCAQQHLPRRRPLAARHRYRQSAVSASFPTAHQVRATVMTNAWVGSNLLRSRVTIFAGTSASFRLSSTPAGNPRNAAATLVTRWFKRAKTRV